jgi:DNA-binding MarR family transcriptional regulator
MRIEINHIIASVDRLGDRRHSYRQDLRRHRISPPLLLILRLLETRPGLTMVELSRQLGISVPTMQSRISRRRSVEDRRKVPTELSRRGRRVLRQVPLAGAGRLLDALERGEITPRRLQRLAQELENVERLLFPDEERLAARRRAPVWRR